MSCHRDFLIFIRKMEKDRYAVIRYGVSPDFKAGVKNDVFFFEFGITPVPDTSRLLLGSTKESGQALFFFFPFFFSFNSKHPRFLSFKVLVVRGSYRSTSGSFHWPVHGVSWIVSTSRLQVYLSETPSGSPEFLKDLCFVDPHLSHRE